MFELFYIVISGSCIADYESRALIIVGGCTVTYNCEFLCHFGILWRVVSLAVIPHLRFYKAMAKQNRKTEVKPHFTIHRT